MYQVFTHQKPTPDSSNSDIPVLVSAVSTGIKAQKTNTNSINPVLVSAVPQVSTGFQAQHKPSQDRTNPVLVSAVPQGFQAQHKPTPNPIKSVLVYEIGRGGSGFCRIIKIQRFKNSKIQAKKFVCFCFLDFMFFILFWILCCSFNSRFRRYHQSHRQSLR